MEIGILSAGDVGKPEILEALGALAPLTAIRGNIDRGIWAQKLHHTEVVQVEQVSIYVIHDIHEMDLDPAAAGFQAVVSGHSHQPMVEQREGVLYLNPGSAGPRRFQLPVTMARLTIQNTSLRAELIDLLID
jgi:putative phosphoesterase